MKAFLPCLLAFLRLALGFEQRRFAIRLNSPEKSQDAVFRSILRTAIGTGYGRSLGLKADTDYASFQALVPIATYEDLLPWIDAQESGATPHALTPGRVLFYEPTSGSSGKKKVIPYNRALLLSFSSLLRIWTGDVLGRLRFLRTGTFYFSVTPEAGGSQGQGLADDSSYAQGMLGWIFRRFSAVSSDLKAIHDSDRFFEILACQLMARGDLELASIWNPSFFLQVVDFILTDKPALLKLLASGQSVFESRTYTWRIPSSARLDAIAKARTGAELWPQLRFISCWDAAEAGMSADALRAAFPSAWVQGKGLLATEAPVTLPFRGQHCPLLHEIFFEFLAADGKVLRLHELIRDECYELVLSHKGGFLRYKLGDRVRAVASDFSTPSLRFEGRSGATVDLFGEKMEESFLRSAVAEGGGRAESFWACLPYRTAPSQGFYLMLTDQMDFTEADLESALLHSHHYRLARRLRQLQAVRVVCDRDARFHFYHLMNEAGRKLGDLKSDMLIRDLQSADHVVKALLARNCVNADESRLFDAGIPSSRLSWISE